MESALEHLNELPKEKEELKPVNWLDILKILISAIAYILDILLDIYVAYVIFNLSQTGFGVTSLIFIIFQSLAANLTSWQWYKNDGKKLSKKDFLVHVLLLAPLLRYSDTFKYGIKSYREEDDSTKKYYLERFLRSNADIAFLCVMEGFLEAGPQLILQLALLMPTIPSESSCPDWDRCISVTISLVNLGLAMANFHTAQRRPQDIKKDINKPGLVFQFLWHLLISVSRVISISCLVSLFPIWVLVACILHVIISFICLLINGPNDILCDSKVWHCAILLFVACIYIFVGIPLREGPTRRFYTILFSVFFLENLTLVGIWYWKMAAWQLAFIIPSVSISCFLLGIVFMILYHKFFHPNKLSSQGKQSTDLTQQKV